jgi:hypothetical protein
MIGTLEDEEKACYLGLPFIIENTGKTPARDLLLQLFYPKECLVEKNAVIVDRAHEVAYVHELKSCEHREVYSLGDFVQVTLTFPILRPGEKIASFEFLKFGQVNLEVLKNNPLLEFEDATVESRYLSCPGLLGLNVIRMTLLSSDSLPLSEDVMVCWVNALTTEELGQRFMEFGSRIWDGRRPSAGMYFQNPLLKSIRWKTELAELVLPSNLPHDMTLSPEAVMLADRTIGFFEMPPWGFFGTSYDIVQKSGMQRVPTLWGERGPVATKQKA